ncbi:MAG: Hsp70 family protein [Methylococcus sp.]|nr:MAG: Hsp70 family protein [Methylococcus sp.]
MTEPRFAVGIDLGTTNSVVSSVRLDTAPTEKVFVELLPIPQLTGPGTVESRHQLPSFQYQAHQEEIDEAEVVLPWNSKPLVIIGEWARMLGSKTPIRLVGSAKSWLSHQAVNRRSAILPCQAPEDVPRISPLDASTAYLRHLHDAWNHAHPEAPLIDQKVVLTVPASFDPAARDLTVEAAEAAGLPRPVLLEEPQAAFYSWLEASDGRWRESIRPGEVILVVDVGGGTTDFSLIAVGEAAGLLTLERVAIGDHILLGGDNMDLALAYGLRTKLEAEGRRLESWQVLALTYACREAKEALLLDAALNEVAIVVPSRGTSLMGGLLRTRLTQEEVTGALVEGFFPSLDLHQVEWVHHARTGLTTLGLPYAQDPRITAHLALFLRRQLEALKGAQEVLEPFKGGHFVQPTAVLLNGGIFRSERLRQKLLVVLNEWLLKDAAAPARLLEGVDLDLAVARGAAYYGWVRQGPGVRIRSGTAAAYYVGVESSMPAVPGFPAPLEALCIAPFGMEEGTEAALPPVEFGVVVGEPVRFRFFTSKVRRDDEVGTRLDWWPLGDLEALADIEVVLPVEAFRPGDIVPVHLVARVTEVGRLELEAVATTGGHRWKVAFEVRGDPGAQTARP